GDQLRTIDAAQREQEVRLRVEPRADAIEDCGRVFAHVRPVRARAPHFNFTGARKESVSLPAHALHHVLGNLSLKQFHQRSDGAQAVLANRFPARFWDGVDIDPNRVEFRPAHYGPDLTALDLQIDD